MSDALLTNNADREDTLIKRIKLQDCENNSLSLFTEYTKGHFTVPSRLQVKSHPEEKKY